MAVKKIGEVYKCSICGNVVSVHEVGGGTLVCCGKEMELLEEQTAEQEGKEKHVPVVETNGNTVSVKVGSVPHPMTPEHYIELIQLLKDGEVIVEKRLLPTDKPEATFYVDGDPKDYTARELCNIHGLWVS